MRIILLLIPLILSACSISDWYTQSILEKAPYPPVASEAVNGIARQKTQLNSGLYDREDNKTYIVYPGGKSGSASACAPYIITYNHSTETWSTPVEVAPSPVKPDAHNYPQVLQDSRGRIHVLHSFHGNHEILHGVTKNPRDISSWEISYIPGTEDATYGAAFKARNGDFYLFYRGRDDSGPDCEPEYFLKSTDDGEIWIKKRLINPIPYNDNWGTIYTKAMSYQEQPEGLIITFGLHKLHNKYIDRHFYVFFSFENNNLYSAGGLDLGNEITRQTFESSCELFRYGRDTEFSNIRMAADLDSSGTPWVFYNHLDENRKSHLTGAVWNNSTSSWDFFTPQLTGVYPFKLEIDQNGSMTLYARTWGRKMSAYYFQGTQYLGMKDLFEAQQDSGLSVHQPSFIYPEAPGIKGTFIWGDSAHWSTPNTSGFLFTF